MCVFCAAIPVAAATGTYLDNKQRKNAQVLGHNQKRLRPFVLLTILVIFILVTGSVIVHVNYYRQWL